VLKEVRIWGPRVLQDGSLGKRELDHRWKRTVTVGGINVDDLPAVVVRQLCSYASEASHA
jgi:exodeoxyribonuclease-3